MNQKRDENLMLVVATEQYAKHNNLTTVEAFAVLCEYGINRLIRLHYPALHTQSLEDSYYFAEDIINRKKNEK